MAQELSKPAITSDGSGKTKPSRSVSLTPELTFRQITSLAKELTIVNILILCNDVALTPGPMAKKTCNACFKTIRKNQAETNCSECSCIYHLKCIRALFFVLSTVTKPGFEYIHFRQRNNSTIAEYFHESRTKVYSSEYSKSQREG